MNIASPNVIDD